MDYVLVAKDGIDNVADLKGATIAMSGPEGFSTMLTRLLMRKEGLDPNTDARFVQIGGSPERAAALLAGAADAANIHVEDWFEIRSRTDGLTPIVTVGEVLPEMRLHRLRAAHRRGRYAPGHRRRVGFRGGRGYVADGAVGDPESEGVPGTRRHHARCR